MFTSIFLTMALHGAISGTTIPLPQTTVQTDTTSAYATVNGIKMYYEIHGSGSPLVLIHGGGSTIRTTFGQVLHDFAQHHQVIAVELQGHGHTEARPGPTTFEQDADDVAALLKTLHVQQADILGFSNGGCTALQIGVRHPELVRRIVAISSFYKREGLPPMFWDMMKKAHLSDMPQPFKDAFLAVHNDPKALQTMFNQDNGRMLAFKDWPDDMIRSIKVPTLILISDQDAITPEHATAMYRLLPKGRLSILPGQHGEFLGDVLTAKHHSHTPQMAVAMIDDFLNE
ncbi:alpha/beta fold hydrolase [Chitinophaga varians]|uniref:alpha/beta fold hydrolase n=1 Tax=Chitinophaga varians TaxID=2202339 RepID=UPI00165EEEA3|nr:alpha/beta hydrolase [Chitinophaga varians]MBC9914590.1 alpha/beta fold hydrolase [Chitinophaga varians]